MPPSKSTELARRQTHRAPP